MLRVIQGPTVKWVDIQNPTRKDIDDLRRSFHFHPLVLDELLIPAWRPKVERFPDYLSLILYYPVYSKERKETRPRELDILVTKNALITVHYSSIVPVKALFDKCNMYPEARGNYLGQSSGYLLFYVLSGFWKQSLLKLTRVNLKIDQIEEKIFQGEERTQVREISLAKADVINFWRIVEPQGEILERLRKEGADFFGSEVEPYLSDIVDDYNQSVHELETARETVRALEETNNSLLTAKTNEVVRLLTVLSTLILPLTLIASIFGMNVELPIGNHTKDYWFIMIFMAIAVVTLYLYFKRKRWV
ncbi:MAG: magnesium transporter CorA family protein [Parcubacteria group bacterium]|nr:magnesium transporter CorA family protein [Parcubacteria group bacterium]